MAQDSPTKQALKIQVGSATREDVARLLGKPWRTSNDADCDAEQYGAVWEYLFKDANGTSFRVHVAFSKDGKVSLVAKIRSGVNRSSCHTLPKKSTNIEDARPQSRKSAPFRPREWASLRSHA